MFVQILMSVGLNLNIYALAAIATKYLQYSSMAWLAFPWLKDLQKRWSAAWNCKWQENDCNKFYCYFPVIVIKLWIKSSFIPFNMSRHHVLFFVLFCALLLFIYLQIWSWMLKQLAAQALLSFFCCCQFKIKNNKCQNASSNWNKLIFFLLFVVFCLTFNFPSCIVTYK